MKFNQKTQVAGDCTAWYEITDYKSDTVKGLIDEILQNNREWGDIKILDGPDAKWWDCPKCEYRYGTLVSRLPDELLCKKIKSVKANGGWTCMNYYVSVES